MEKLLIKAQKKLDKVEFSEYAFVREYQKNVVAFYQNVIEMIFYGIAIKLGADPTKFKKSFDVKTEDWKTFFKADIEHDHTENTELIKALFDNIRKKVSFTQKLWKKFSFGKKGFMGKQNFKLEPMKLKGKFTYDTKGKRITKQEWKNMEDSVIDYLDISNIEDEIVVRGALLGKLVERMESEKKPKQEMREISWRELEGLYGDIPNSISDAKTWFSKNEYESLQYVKDHALEHLAIDDGRLKDKMIKMLKRTISEGVKNHTPIQELTQNLFWVDPTSEFGKKFNKETIETINRDYKRIALTEMMYAMNEGYLQASKQNLTAEEKKDGVYFVFGGGIKYGKTYTKPSMSHKEYVERRYAERHKGGKAVSRTPNQKYKQTTCKWCEGWLGKIVKLVDAPMDDDRATDDKYADFYIWSGKNNVGRQSGSWWICVPAHPNCQHFWSKINPRLQDFDRESGLIFPKELVA